MKSEYLIRKRNRRDCRAIARLVTISWNETYQGIVPDWYLQELKHNEKERTEKAVAEFSEEKNPFLVLEVNGELAGFVWYGPAYDKVFDDCGEIIALYLIQKYQGRGLGRQLMEAALHELKMLGYEKMVIA